MIVLFKRGKRLSIFATRHFATVTKCDALVLGGGIGGASLSYRLAKLHKLKVVCIEKEASGGYQATGKAFGIFAESNARCTQSKLLTHASRPFFESPDPECIDSYIADRYFEKSILTKTGLLAISSPEDYNYLYEQFGPSEKTTAFNQNIKVFPQKDIVNMVPFLKQDELAPYGLFEPNAANFNIGLVYEHFIVGGNKVGVKYYFNQSAIEMTKNNNGNWDVLSYNADKNRIDRFEAAILVNCTGEWGDDTAEKAGMKKIGLDCVKRNIIKFDYTKGNIGTKESEGYTRYPFRMKQAEKQPDNYDEKSHDQIPWLGWISPKAGEIFHSSFNGGNGIFIYDQVVDIKEEDMEFKHIHAPHVQDEMEIVLHKLSKYTSLNVEKVQTKAAGIRCFSKHDKNIVIGPAKEDNSFIWCNALGSYGVQLAPAYSEIGSYLAVNKELPKWYTDLGIDVDKLLPKRLHGHANVN